jgi:hypothetical protein
MGMMKSPQLQSRLGKVCTAIAASLILPALAYAGTDNGKGNHDQDNGNQYGKDNDHRPPMVTTPEANTGMVLIPFFGAVLLFSSLHLFRAKAAQKNGARP